MSNPAANLSVWVGDKIVCIKIAGRASFQGSVDFKTLVLSMWQKGYTRFVLEVSGCQLMDSTFLGVLAGLGLRFAREPNGFGPSTIELLNPSPRVIELLDTLGILHLFKVLHGSPRETQGLAPLERDAAASDRKETTRTCLEAHKLLMEINPENVAKFKDVTRFLEEDLKKMGGQS